MSLLMQALKRAEDAKKRQSADDAELALDTVDTAPGASVAATRANQAGIRAGEDFPELILVEEDEAVKPANAIAALSLQPAIEQSVQIEAQPDPAPPAPAEMRLALEEVEPATISHTPIVEPQPEPVVESAVSVPAAAEQAPPPVTVPTAHAESTPPPESAPSERNKAKMVFSAKQSKTRRRTVVLASSFVLGLALAVGGYLYLQSILSNIASGSSFSPQAAAVQAAPAATPAGESAPPATPAPPSTAASAPAAESASALAAKSIQPPASQPSDRGDKTKPVAAEPLVVQAVENSGIQIRPGSATPRIDPSLQRAYQAFQQGELTLASQEYRAALQADPNNRDALLGMAAITVRKGQYAEAGNYYVRVLEVDPSDADAQAGLAGLQQGDPVQTESRLKKVLAQNPQSGAAWFALGNLYARQSRWSEAQQAYFTAFGNAPSNADYVFNLAVSLDQLAQPRLATEYYQRALALAKTHPSTFSKTAANQRLQALQAELP